MPTVQPGDEKPDFYDTLASDLVDLAGKIRAMSGKDLVPCSLSVRFYPYGDGDPTNIAAIDAFGQAVLGKPGKAIRMDDGSYHHNVEGRHGQVEVAGYTGIASPEDRARDDEIARLRSRIADLESGRP